MRVRAGRWAAWVVLALAASSASAQLRSAPPSGDPPASAAAAVPPAAVPAAPVSLSARKVYEQARSQLVQIRTVLKGRASQTSVGSGFLVSAQGHIITNFHVVSEAALKPDRHDLVYVTADGREAPLVILQLDVLHDLALLRAGDAGAGGAGRTFDALPFRPASEPLSQGERIYSLGNPLDVGFTITQGTYNGLVRRSFYPQIFFGGALSGGMSGGPALDEEGHVIGVNVARRVDGEQVSFLVPAEFATALLARGKDAAPIIGPAYGIVGEQLLKHQAALTDRFVAQGWKDATHPRYHVPVPPDVFMRCWGTSEVSRTGGLDFERSECQMDTRVFVGEYTTGTIAVRHESYDGSKLGPLRFAARYSLSFRNEAFVRLSSQHQTKPRCNEDFIERGGLPLRAVVCMRAYKKLPQLYDVAVLVATLDQNQSGVQGRFDAQGVSFANAQRLARHYLDAFRWVQAHYAEPLALLEVVDRDGFVRQAWRIEHWPVSIGRALDNTVVLSDPHVAAHHATLDLVDGAEGAPAQIVVSAGETRNGVGVGRERVAGGASTSIADAGRDIDLHIGRAQLRLRLPGHSLAAEQAMTPVVVGEKRWLPTFGLALAVLLVVLANTWIDTDPEGLTRAAGAIVLTTIAGGAIWCGLWALLSKTFTRQSQFGWHVRVFVIASLVTLTLAVLPPLLAFAFSWPWITDFSFVAVYATIAGAIYFHLLAVEPARERLMRGVAATGFVVGVALTLWFNVQRTGRPGEELYMNHLFPPQLRLAKANPVDSLIDGLAPMQAILDRKAKEQQSGGDSDSRGGDDEE